MKSEKYWEEAALEREAAAHLEAEEYVNKLLKLYEDASNDITGEIKRIEYNYGKRFGLDEETARYFLSHEMNKDLTGELAELLLNAKTDREREAILEFIAKDGLSTRAYGARAGRWKALQDEIALRMIQLELAARALGEDIIGNAFKNNYYRHIDDLAAGLDCGVSFALIDDDALEAVLEKPWHGKRFSERVWGNTQKLADETQEIVGRYLVSGRDPRKAVKEIQERFEVAEYRATTLIRTEIGHARSQGDLKAYDEMGVEKIEFVASLDERTCEQCGPLDGSVIFRRDIREGVNYPLIHPRCRCTTCALHPGAVMKRRARNPETGKWDILDGSVTYDEWRNNMTDEEKAAFEKARRAPADKKQYQAYVDRLGKKANLRSFDKFREMKYNDTEGFKELQAAYRYAGKNPGADLKTYKCVQELKSLGVKGSIHIPKKEIDISALGFDDEHINKERKHGVTEKQAKNYIEKAVLSISKRNGMTENYYSKMGAVYVNPIENVIKTTFNKSEFKGDAVIIMEVLKRYGY